MIVLIEDKGMRIVVTDVHTIQEKALPSLFGDDGTRKVVNLFNEAGEVLLDGESISLEDTKITPLPNAERLAHRR